MIVTDILRRVVSNILTGVSEMFTAFQGYDGLDQPGQTFADQELLPIFPESRGPPHILIFFSCIPENPGNIQKYCNKFAGSISRWKFITLNVQYTTLDYSSQLFSSSHTRMTDSRITAKCV
jgi:hypothetical protein